MSMKLRRLQTREIVLLVTLAAVGVAVLWYHDPERGAGGTGGTAKEDAFRVGDVPVVHLDRLDAEAEAYDPRGRNLFQYYTPPPPPAPAPPPPKPQPVVVQAPVEFKPQPPRVPEAPKPPPISLTYLGLIGPKWKKIAFFDPGGGEDLIMAQVGDVIQGQFVVVDFGYESIVMGYTDERFRDQTVELRQLPTKTAGGPRGRRRQ